MFVPSEMELFIQTLSEIDLTKVSVDEVVNLFNQMPTVMLQPIDLDERLFVIRGRPNLKDQLFYYKNEISHIKDLDLLINVRRNRANDIGEGMFYGGIPLVPGKQELDQVVPMIETDILKSYTEERVEQLITIGKWRIKSPLRAIILPHFESYYERNPYLKGMQESYFEVINKNHEIQGNSLMFSEFIATEFAKRVERDKDYLYKITIAFRKLINQNGAKGLIYPSVRSIGETLNIVLEPRIAESHLSLEKVAVYRMIQQGDFRILYPEFSATIDNEDEMFNYQPEGEGIQEMRKQFEALYKLNLQKKQ